MPQSTVEMTKDILMAQIASGNLSPEDMQDAMSRIHQTLTALKSREEAESPAPTTSTPQTPVNWRPSITRHTVTCMECGQTFQQLSLRHLRQHDLDGRLYRQKYGIPQSQPLAARATTAKRRQIMLETKPWERAPAYIKGQQAKVAAAKKSSRKKAAKKG